MNANLSEFIVTYDNELSIGGVRTHLIEYDKNTLSCTLIINFCFIEYLIS